MATRCHYQAVTAPLSGVGLGWGQEWVPCLMSRGRSWAPFYHPHRSCGKVMFLHLSVILSRGGVCLSACWDTPPGQTPPPQQTATAADGTHPTGMHSCVTRVLI